VSDFDLRLTRCVFVSCLAQSEEAAAVPEYVSGWNTGFDGSLNVSFRLLGLVWRGGLSSETDQCRGRSLMAQDGRQVCRDARVQSVRLSRRGAG
jgi:hypothetical protein